MRLARIAIGVAALWCAAPAYAENVDSEPYEAMRRVTAMQDRLLTGARPDKAEQQAMNAAFVQIAVNADAKAWTSARNRRAVALYLLSGGGGAPFRQLVGRMPTEGDEKNLLDGALAFAEGREKEALAALGPLEPRNLPADIGGQVALTQGVLSLASDRAKAMEALDLARLLSPGALVEEAALRRQVFVASEGEDAARFVALSERYRLRFRNSAYAANFQTRFREGFLRLWIERDDDVRASLDRSAIEMTRPEAAALMMEVARAALARGALAPAKTAAQRAGASLEPTDPLSLRAQLYEAAAAVLDAGASADMLRAIDAARLSVEERVLRESSLLIAAAMAASIEGDAPADNAPPTPLMRKAVELIAESDRLRVAE